jgi:hypothetical protein
MEEYQMELLTIDTFIIEGKIRKRGIIQFLANGKHNDFAIDIKYFDNKNIPPLENLSKADAEEALEDENAKEADSAELSDSDDEESNNKSKPIRIRNSQFNKLEFSEQPETFEEVHKEINEDVNEFLECMKNSIFYGSGIQRFYNSELDKFKRRFLELEQKKGRWRYYVERYIKLKDPKVNIPAPNIDDEIREREKMVTNIKAIKNIYRELDGRVNGTENENDTHFLEKEDLNQES